MHPTHGGRFVLELTQQSDDEVVYSVSLLLPSESWTTSVRVALREGVVSFDTFAPADTSSAPAPPAWLVSKTQAFLRSEWKSSQGPSAAPWPRRIQRWREG